MSAVGGLRDQLSRTATDPNLDPASRVRNLRRLRDRIASQLDRSPSDRSDLTTLLGQADTYIGDNELRREASALSAAMSGVEAREEADLRDDLLDDGYDAKALDDAGYLSHEQLDAATGVEEEP